MNKLFTKAQAALATRRQNEEGAAMVEYGMLVAGIAVVAYVGVQALGGGINGLFNDITF